MISIRDNITQIKYIKIRDKLYRVTDISFTDMNIHAAEATPAAEISQNTVFDIAELKEFRIRLVNNSGMADVVEFGAWKTANNVK